MTDQQEDARPSYVTDTHLEFLDALRESGVTNMFGAASYVEERFENLESGQPEKVLAYWMETFGARHPKEDKQHGNGS